jgi:hypothetical protein
MNHPRPIRAYVSIFLAFAILFACGVAVGRRAAPPPAAAPAASLDDGRWEDAAFVALQRELELTDGQHPRVRAELADTAARLRSVRDSAVAESHRALIDLSDRLAPHLEPEQRNILDRDRLRLQRILISRSAPDSALRPSSENPRP